MKKNDILIILFILSFSSIWSCSDMNDLHDPYLRDGEITYVGRIDSLKSFSGRERVLIQYWISDPRVKHLQILWNQRQDSIRVPVPPHDPTDSLEVMIGDGNGEIPEGDHTFFFYSHDDRGHRSIVFESLISVYGERYQSSLINRPVSGTELDEEGNLIINWGGSISSDEIGIDITYYNEENRLIDLFIPTDTLVNPVMFDDVDPTKPISYRTMYVPDEFAIDTFYTSESESIKVMLIENVALHKQTIVSDMLNSSYHGGNAVDGIISSQSRWVSTPNGEHWIEVDLGQPYSIQSFKTYNGSGNAPNAAISNFMFQASIADEWVTIVEVTGNIDHSFGSTFEEVVTDKVRLFVPDYANNQVRLFELEVYSIVTLN